MYDRHSEDFPVGRIVGIAGAVIVGILLVVTLFKSFTIVDHGTVGVVKTFGAVQPEEWQPGFHFKKPWVDSVEHINTQLKGVEVKEAEAASKDLQRVTTAITIQHNVNPAMAAEVFQEVGDLEKIDADVMIPAVHESLKAVTAKYTAVELVTKREAVKLEVVEHIKKFVEDTLKSKNVTGAIAIANVAITDFQFSKEFNDSIEAKVKAEQEALRAEREKAKRVTNAETAAIEKKRAADARAYEIEKNSIARADAIKREAEALKNNPDLVRLRAIEAWDGTLPTYQGGPMPLPFFQVNPPGDKPKGQQ